MRDRRFPFLRNNHYAADIDPFGRAAILAAWSGDRTVDLLISFAWLAVVTWLILRAINQCGLLPRVAIAAPLAAERAPRIVPLGYTIGAIMALNSVRRRVSGQVTWKGRIYS
jgi:hypothetical protein